MMNWRTLAFATLALASATSAPAAEVRSKTVSLAGVRLDDPASMAAVERRLVRAANIVCTEAGSRLLDIDGHRCRKEALQRAQADLRRVQAASAPRLAGAYRPN
jgi:UrcA family protein